MADFKLLIEDEAGKTIVVPLVRDEITIGRKEGNTIRLTERNVSRFHAKLTKVNGQVFIEDLQSYNGIKINGDRIKGRVEVREGDLIEIGDYHLALQSEGASHPVLEPTVDGGATTQYPRAPAPPQAVSQTVEPPSPDDEDDDFAGDTQRWDPLADLDPVQVGNLPTLEQAPTTSGEAPSSMEELDLGETARFMPAPSQEMEPAAKGRPQAGGAGPSAQAAEVADALASAPTARHETRDLGASLPNISPDEVTLKSPSAPAPAVPGPADQPSAPIQALTHEEVAGRFQAAAAPPFGGTAPNPSEPSLLAEERTESVAIAPGPASAKDLDKPRLVALNTVFAGTVFTFHQEEAVVGRTEDNDITIQHKSISRRHCKLRREGADVRIFDLGSANGILLNGEEIEQAVLRAGDVIELGRVRLRYVPPGEVFELSSEEIERARVADAAGEEWSDEGGTLVTTPKLEGSGIGTQKPPRALLAAAVVALLVILAVVAFLVFGGGASGDDDLSPQAQALLDKARALEDEGSWDAALLQYAAAEQAGAKMAAQRGRQRIEAARKILDMKKALDEKRYEDVRRLANNIPPDADGYPEARALADKATAALADQTASEAGRHLDAKDLDDANDALARLKALEGESERYQRLQQRLDALEEPAQVEPRQGEERRFAQKSRAQGRGTQKRAIKPTGAQKRPEETRRESRSTPRAPRDPDVEVEQILNEAQMAILMKGDSRRAISLLQRAEKLAPDRHEVHRLLGLAYKNQNRRQKAAYHFKRYLSLRPGAPDRQAILEYLQEAE